MTDNKASTWFFQAQQTPKLLKPNASFCIYFSSRPGNRKFRSWLLFAIGHWTSTYDFLNLTDNVPVYNREIELASKTPKQDDYEEKYDHHAQPQQPVTPPEAQMQPDDVMNILPMKLHEMAGDFERHQAQMRNDFVACSLKEQTPHYVKLLPNLPLRQQVIH